MFSHIFSILIVVVKRLESKVDKGRTGSTSLDQGYVSDLGLDQRARERRIGSVLLGSRYTKSLTNTCSWEDNHWPGLVSTSAWWPLSRSIRLPYQGRLQSFRQAIREAYWRLWKPREDNRTPHFLALCRLFCVSFYFYLYSRYMLPKLTSELFSAKALKEAKDASRLNLRSGLYLLRSSDAGDDVEQLYVIYWPEDTTWNDNAGDSVRRNRITFMRYSQNEFWRCLSWILFFRYLSKISDQILCFISPEQAHTIVWNDRDELKDAAMDVDNEDSDRLFTFEVAKTNEQEENVTVRPGFRVRARRHFHLLGVSITFAFQISLPNLGVRSGDMPLDIPAEHFQPKLLFGETEQGFISMKYIPAFTEEQPLHQKPHTAVHLRSLL